MQGALGVIVFLTCAWSLCANKKNIAWKDALKGLFVHVSLTFLILRFAPLREFFHGIGKGIQALREATLQGTQFVFGYLGGGPLPFSVENPSNLFIFAFQALPLLIVLSSLSYVLFHWGVLPRIVLGISWFFRKTLNIGGALGLCSGAKIFLGQTDAPLLIRPYLVNMSRGEIFTIMCMGFSTTSGTILAIYAAILSSSVPDVLTHIVTASVINIPAAITLSRLMIPHESETQGCDVMEPYKFSSSMDALAKGSEDGMKLFLSLISILIVFIACVALVNQILGLIPLETPLTLQKMLGYMVAPVTWLMGIPLSDIESAGGLLGIKTILNELYAYSEMATLSPQKLSSFSRVVMTYGLCGFANISSIGIVIGGLGALVPSQRSVILSLGWKALLIGTLASCMSASVVSLFL